MYAVIKTGGKQYRVAKDDRLSVERLPAEPGTMIALSPVDLPAPLRPSRTTASPGATLKETPASTRARP